MQLWSAPPADATVDDLTLPESVTGASASFVTIGSDAVVVSGYDQTIRVVISSDNPDARFTLTTTTSLTRVAGYANQTTITAAGNPIAFEATGPNAQAGLRGLQYKSTPGSSDTISIDVSPQGIASRQDAVTGLYHYYRAVSGSRTWTEARVHSRAPVSLGGSDRVGWLATIGSADENKFVTNYVNSDAWMGAFDGCAKDLVVDGSTTVATPASCAEGKWFWVPEAGDIGGVQFMDTNTAPSAGKFVNWATGEPNNTGTEDAGQFYSTNTNSSGARWNDLPHASSNLSTYIWEFASATPIGGLALTRTMAASTPAAAPSNSAVPTISGSAQTGATLTAAEGTWSTGGAVVSATTYQWKRIKSGVTTNIVGATGATLCVPNNADVIGSTVVVTVTKTNSAGSTSATSVATGVVSEDLSCAAPPAPPAPEPGPAVGPTVVPPPAPAPGNLNFVPATRPSTVPATGPVLRNNQAPTPPAQPTATVGGLRTVVQTQFTGSSSMNLVAGVFSLGLSLQPNQGTVRQGTGGASEVEVPRGGRTTLQGSGLLPGSTVQVFLPFNGSNSREIARLPVSQSGTFSGDAVFGATPTERPLPIGRHVMQVVTIDENRQRAVVEMTINIAQSQPSPESDRTTQTLPTLLPGLSFATNGGEPTPAQVTAFSDQGLATIEGDGWSMAVGVGGGGGVSDGEGGGAMVEFIRNESAQVSGAGFMPGTRADVWLFSTPTLLGSVVIDDNGEFNGDVTIDGNVITVGEHTLQLQGVGEDGFVRAANLGVVVNDAAAEATVEEASGFLGWLWAMAALGVIVLGAGGTWWYRRATR